MKNLTTHLTVSQSEYGRWKKKRGERKKTSQVEPIKLARNERKEQKRQTNEPRTINGYDYWLFAVSSSPNYWQIFLMFLFRSIHLLNSVQWQTISTNAYVCISQVNSIELVATIGIGANHESDNFMPVVWLVDRQKTASPMINYSSQTRWGKTNTIIPMEWWCASEATLEN